MVLLGNFLSALANIFHILLMIFIWVIIIRVVLSWVNVPSLYPLALVLYKLTEPFLRPVRRLVPPARLGGIDLSPFIIVLLIIFVDSFLVKSLAHYALQLTRSGRIVF
jgi:YggT family protein